MTFDVDINIEDDHCCRNRCLNIDGDFFYIAIVDVVDFAVLDVVFVDIDADLNVFF